jgi:hypothetical protein
MCSRKSRPKQAQTGPKVRVFFLTASLLAAYKPGFNQLTNLYK